MQIMSISDAAGLVHDNDTLVIGGSGGRHPAPIRFLNPGDTIAITIEPVGELTNPVIEEKHDG